MEPPLFFMGTMQVGPIREVPAPKLIAIHTCFLLTAASSSATILTARLLCTTPLRNTASLHQTYINSPPELHIPWLVRKADIYLVPR
jgi:hypothetical protein